MTSRKRLDGPTLLRAYLDRTGKTQQQFAKEAQIKPDQVSRYLSRQRTPEVPSALAIARTTNGAVPVEAWEFSGKGPHKAA